MEIIVVSSEQSAGAVVRSESRQLISSKGMIMAVYDGLTSTRIDRVLYITSYMMLVLDSKIYEGLLCFFSLFILSC